MLIVTRKDGESFCIRDDVTITAHTQSHNNQVKLCIHAPEEVLVLRGELLEETEEKD